MALCWVIFLIYYVYQSVHVRYPTKSEPIVSYYEESGHDLKYLYCAFLQSAQKSILISSYGLSDPDIKRILKEKQACGIEVTYYNSKNEKKHRQKVSGLYHRKILIIDDTYLFIGSANCTLPALCYQGNQIFGFNNKELIDCIKKNSSYISDNFFFYLLPGFAKPALSQLLGLIECAKDEIKLAMFSLTHPEIIDSLIAAHTRGVKISIYLDRARAYGLGRKYNQKLTDAGIKVSTRSIEGILHHKCAKIDDAYIFGSTNFSKAGFSKNEEILIIIPQTPPPLTKQINHFFSSLHSYSLPIMPSATKGS